MRETALLNSIIKLSNSLQYSLKQFSFCNLQLNSFFISKRILASFIVISNILLEFFIDFFIIQGLQ